MAGQIRVVQGGTDFDQIHARQLHPAQRAEKLEGFARSEPAGDRRSSAGRESGVDGVYVEGHVDGSAAEPLADFARHRRHAVPLDLFHRHLAGVVRAGEVGIADLPPGCAQAHLNETARGDQVFGQRMPQRRAVMVRAAPCLRSAGVEVRVHL
ncbi:MAG: hypothetical protein AUI48_00645 [Chloroflexi bacterium 13_1_40CM_2_68_14]|nr:MAG: hypothetical protein AUI48_00645 [Chloroflexi bacterium 13_1_40CM_2_68_14]